MRQCVKCTGTLTATVVLLIALATTCAVAITLLKDAKQRQDNSMFVNIADVQFRQVVNDLTSKVNMVRSFKKMADVFELHRVEMTEEILITNVIEMMAKGSRRGVTFMLFVQDALYSCFTLANECGQPDIATAAQLTDSYSVTNDFQVVTANHNGIFFIHNPFESRPDLVSVVHVLLHIANDPVCMTVADSSGTTIFSNECGRNIAPVESLREETFIPWPFNSSVDVSMFRSHQFEDLLNTNQSTIVNVTVAVLFVTIVTSMLFMCRKLHNYNMINKNAQLLMANRHALKQVTNHADHEIRNPLMILDLSLRPLENNGDKETLRECLACLHMSLNDLQRVKGFSSATSVKKTELCHCFGQIANFTFDAPFTRKITWTFKKHLLLPSSVLVDSKRFMHTTLVLCDLASHIAPQPFVTMGIFLMDDRVWFFIHTGSCMKSAHCMRAVTTMRSALYDTAQWQVVAQTVNDKVDPNVHPTTYKVIEELRKFVHCGVCGPFIWASFTRINNE